MQSDWNRVLEAASKLFMTAEMFKVNYSDYKFKKLIRILFYFPGQMRLFENVNSLVDIACRASHQVNFEPINAINLKTRNKASSGCSRFGIVGFSQRSFLDTLCVFGLRNTSSHEKLYLMAWFQCKSSWWTWNATYVSQVIAWYSQHDWQLVSVLLWHNGKRHWRLACCTNNMFDVIEYCE